MMIQTNSAQVRDTEIHHAAVQQVLRDLTAGLRGIYGDAMPRVLLFGSQARGDAHGDSDIDVLLLFSKPIQPLDEIRRVSNLLYEINLDYGELVSLFPGTERQGSPAPGEPHATASVCRRSRQVQPVLGNAQEPAPVLDERRPPRRTVGSNCCIRAP